MAEPGGSDYDELISELNKLIDPILKNNTVKTATHYLQILGVTIYTARLLMTEIGRNILSWGDISAFALIIIGYAGWISARLSLGSFFTVRPQALGLVKTGIYSKFRNPIYIFSMLYFLGLGIHLAVSWWLLAAGFAIVAYVQVFRSAAEAKVLREHYKQEYEDYEKDVWI